MRNAESRLVGGNCGVEQDGFSVGIGDNDLLWAGGEAGSCDEKSVGILECDAGSFSIDCQSGGVLEATAADGEGGTAACCSSDGRDGANSQGNDGELNDGQSGVLRRAVGGGDSEEPLAIFVDGKKIAVKAVDLGEELLREKNAQTNSARMGIENIDAALDSCAGRNTGKAPEGCRVTPGTD
jgi:hypothetical protein